MTGSTRDSGGRVTVERLTCTYLVAHDYPAPDVMRPRLDALARDEIAQQFRALLPAVLDPDDPSVWFVRRLDVDIALDVSAAADDVLARSWSERIVDTLDDIVLRGPRGEDVVRFADRAEYLASFVRELTRGQAWGYWYYAPFRGLRSLPAGRAIAEALTREPDWAEDVLLRLDRWGELEATLGLLTEGDAELVWNLNARPDGDVAPSRQMLDAVLAIWPAVHVRGDRIASTGKLHLYIAARRNISASAAGDDLPAAIDLLLRFASMLASTRDEGALVEAIASGNLRRAVFLLNASYPGKDIGALPRLIRASLGDRAWLNEAAHVLAPEGGRTARGDDTVISTPETAITAFGGIFLLLPVLIDLQLDRLLMDLISPDSEEGDCAALIRQLLCVACFGRDRAIAGALDSTLARMSGLHGPPTFEALERAAHMTPVACDNCLRFLAGALARCGWVDGRCLAADLVSLPFGGDVLVLRDTAHDVWLYAGPVAEDCESPLQRALTLALDSADIRPDCLLVHEELNRRLGGKAPVDWPEEILWLRPGEPEPAAYRAALGEYRSRARSALDDLVYFSLAGLHPLSISEGQADLTLCLLARALLRGLAMRLLGFEWSSCPFLYQNFLAGISTVHYTRDWVAVELARPPLHVILSLAGADGQMYDVPWLGGTNVTISLAEG